MGLGLLQTKGGGGRGGGDGDGAGGEKKKVTHIGTKRKSTIQVPFSGRPSATSSRMRKSTGVLAIAGEGEGLDNNNDSDDHEGDIIPESSESFLQQENLGPRKKTRKSIVTNTSTLGRTQAELQVERMKQQQLVKSTPMSKQQQREKQKQKQKQQQKQKNRGWSTSIYSRQGYGQGYEKENLAPLQGDGRSGGREVEVVGGGGTTVEDNACCGGQEDDGGGNGSDAETEYAFGESVEFSSTPKAGVVLGGGGDGKVARGGMDDTTMAE